MISSIRIYKEGVETQEHYVCFFWRDTSVDWANWFEKVLLSGVETYSLRKAFHISGFIGLKLKLHNYDYVIIEIT